MSRPYLFYCTNDPIKNYTALEKLAFTENSGSDADNFTALAAYAALIVGTLQKLQPNTLANQYATQVLGFISTENIESAVTQKNTMIPQDLNDLGVELLHVAAAIGAIDDVIPYTVDELTNYINTDMSAIVPAILAMTLGYVIMYDPEGYGPVLLRMLQGHQDEELDTPYEWIDAFTLGLLMHAAWSYFPRASDREQQFIIQHYFYYAVASRVPVRSWISVAMDTNTALNVGALAGSIGNSQEIIPQDVQLTRAYDMSLLFKDYLNGINQNPIPTLAAEKFLTRWYGTDSTSVLFREWLRVTLNIAYTLQSSNR